MRRKRRRQETYSTSAENEIMEESLQLLQGCNLQPVKFHRRVTGNTPYTQGNEKIGVLRLEGLHQFEKSYPTPWKLF